MKGQIFLCKNTEMVFKNTKLFNITIREQKGDNDIGFMFSKIHDKCIVTMHYGGDMYAQVLINRKCTEKDIDLVFVGDMKKAGMYALGLCETNTLQDLLDLNEDIHL